MPRQCKDKGEEMKKEVDVLKFLNQVPKTYGHVFHCLNCNWNNHREINKGMKIKDIAIECDYCGCVIKEV